MYDLKRIFFSFSLMFIFFFSITQQPVFAAGENIDSSTLLAKVHNQFSRFINFFELSFVPSSVREMAMKQANPNGMVLGATQQSYSAIFLQNLHADLMTDHLFATTVTPKIVIQPSSGIGSVASLLPNANDTVGTIKMYIADRTTSGQLLTVLFAKSYAQPPIVTLTPANSSAAQLGSDTPFVTATTAGFTINEESSSLPAGTYLWNYLAVQ